MATRRPPERNLDLSFGCWGFMIVKKKKNDTQTALLVRPGFAVDRTSLLCVEDIDGLKLVIQ